MPKAVYLGKGIKPIGIREIFNEDFVAQNPECKVARNINVTKLLPTFMGHSDYWTSCSTFLQREYVDDAY